MSSTSFCVAGSAHHFEVILDDHYDESDHPEAMQLHKRRHGLLCHERFDRDVRHPNESTRRRGGSGRFLVRSMVPGSAAAIELVKSGGAEETNEDDEGNARLVDSVPKLFDRRSLGPECHHGGSFILCAYQAILGASLCSGELRARLDQCQERAGESDISMKLNVNLSPLAG
jgi:hypothetical protein